MSEPCKFDVYFFCDNTGSMGSAIAPIQSATLSLLSSIEALPADDPIDIAFGVGNYNDFPLTPTRIRYGDAFFFDAPLYALTLAPGASATLPFVGPEQGPPPTWTSPVTGTRSSPVTFVTIPTTGVYGATLHLRGDGNGAGLVTTRMVSSIHGVVDGPDNFNVAVVSSPWDRSFISTTTLSRNLTAGEQISFLITNNTAATIHIHWNSSLFMHGATPSGISQNPGYALLNQVDIVSGQHNAISEAIGNWRADSGNDYAESWIYGLDQLSTGLSWRSGSSRMIVVIGDAPPHPETCPTLTGLAYTITKESVLDKLVAQNIMFLGISIFGGAGNGLDDADPTSSNTYVAYCGGTAAVPAGQATFLANGTGGFVFPIARGAPTFSTDIVNGVLDIIKLATLPCRSHPGIAQFTAGVQDYFVTTAP